MKIDDNRGITLIEILVVSAILILLSLAAGIGIRLVIARPGEVCAKKLLASIERARVKCLGKNDTTITVQYNDKGEVVVLENICISDEIEKTTTESVVGKSGINISYVLSDGTVKNLISNASAIIICFDRSTGGIRPIEGYEDQYYEQIIVEYRGRKSTISLSYITGKISLR